MSKTKVLEQFIHPKYPRLTLDRRSNSKFYQARTYLDGKLRQKSTGSDHLPTALKLAEEWYRQEVKASVSFGRAHPIEKLTTDPTIGELFASYRSGLPQGKQQYADWRWGPIQDFWRSKTLSSVGPKMVTEFYGWRRKRLKRIKPHTLHKDVVLIRQVLKKAIESELLDQLPVFPKPGPVKANPRPWLTRPEWRHLLSISKARIKDAFGNPKLLKQRQDLHDMMIFMVASMVRVGEMLNLRFRDCRMEKDYLLAEVTGKRGTRTIVGLAEAKEIIERRGKGKGGDEFVFAEHHREGIKTLLKAAGLYEDAFGNTRNMKALRATAISFAILDNPHPNLLLIARNAGTSVTMIDNFYAKRLSAEMGAEALTTRRVPISAYTIGSKTWEEVLESA